MQFFALAALFATALAIPHPPSANTQNICGQAELSCCESTDNSVDVTDTESEGLLSLLDGGKVKVDGLLGKYSGCSSLINKLNLNAVNIAGLSDLSALNDGQCSTDPVCCNLGSGGSQDGLANVQSLCVPVKIL